MSHIDVKYINLLSVRLDKFARKKDNLYNFRCPYCGDSSKNKNRARAFIYAKNSDMVFKCHNCGLGRSLSNFIKDLDVSLHGEYVMEKFTSGLTGRGSNIPEPKFTVATPVFDKSPFRGLSRISELNNSHPAKVYLTNRKIPEKYFSKFYFVDDFAGWAKLDTNIKESRIIIPLISKSGKVFGYQGRTLDSKNPLKYITNILDEKYVKLFGLECLKFDKTIYVTEGPFDSLFLSNAIAMCGSDVQLDKAIYKDRVFVLDNEPRNFQIVGKYDKLINANEKVVIWPETLLQKDINDMVISGINPQEIIKNNTYHGLEAKLKFTKWKRV